MVHSINSDIILSFKNQLESHPVYEAVKTNSDLKCFMEHHVYSVWDFMSLIKYLQANIAPISYPWKPIGDGNVRRFINELVLEEESDQTNVEGEHSSHFELYQQAMTEIGADITASSDFVNTAYNDGIDKALNLTSIPKSSKIFTSSTFQFIQGNKPHEVAAALALGREHIIPCMFRSILDRIGVTETDAPTFHFYLNRHIHLDEDFHAPLSLELLNGLCGGDKSKIDEAITAAHNAVNARVKFWDGVLKTIKHTG